jgi:23S rRNA (adenine2503-C2)-methyltransferase
LFSYVHRDLERDIDRMVDIPARLRRRLALETNVPAPVVAVETDSDDGLTRKYLLELADGRRVETVRMHYEDRVAACLSSQAGCALGCVFCATGQMGFERNLDVGEIVSQALHVARALRAATEPGAPTTLRNIVLMGMGEPLLNYDAVLRAAEILADPVGLAISPKRITLSTVGVAPGIVRLADEARPLSLAVSLHAATQAERAAMIPAARAWPLDILMDACRYYAARLGRRILFEWTLIEAHNDSPEQARELAHLLRDLPARVNLIPLNPTAGFAGQPGDSQSVARFRAELLAHGIPVNVRQRRGIDIAAGCGQLAGAGR